MPIVDLTPRLARETGPVPKDAILFDRKLPGFTSTPWAAKSGSCWPAPRGRSRIAIARHGEMGLAHARRCARNLLAHIRNCDNPAEDIRKKRTAPTLRDLANEYLDHCDPHWKPSVRKTVRIYLKARIPAWLLQVAGRQSWTRGCGRMLRQDEQGPPRRGQTRLRDPALDDVSRRGVGMARAPDHSLHRHPQEPEAPCRPLPRHRGTCAAWAGARRPQGPMARGGIGNSPARAHRPPPRRDTQSALAQHRRRRVALPDSKTSARSV